ncbi:TetR/AcrR family transcriptional regulator [soil metagenome]
MDRRLTQRGEERRRQLMAFAAERFAENGYHPTSVAEIVEGLGVGKGVFYWYFDTKEELLRAILAEGQLDLRRRQRAAIADAATPVARIERGIRASIEWSLEQKVFFRLFQFAATDDRFTDNLRKGEKVAIGDAARHVADAMAAGEIPDSNAEVLAHAMLGVSTHLVQLVHRGLVTPTDDVVETTVKFCLYGIAGPPGPTGGVDTPPPR